MDLNQALNQIGLEEKEARVYLAALELGPATIQDITRKSGINRTTVYQMLKSLKLQSLISETTSGKRKLVLAAEPTNLKQDIKFKEQLLNSILPDLVSLSNINPIKPKIRFYEGQEGHKEIYRETLKAKSKMAYWISPLAIQMETIGADFLDWYIEERKKKNIWIKLIQKAMADTPSKYTDPKIHKRDLKRVHNAPAELNLPNIIVIYDNKVAIMSSHKEGFGFVVESKDYAEMMRTFHDLLWNVSRPYGSADKNDSDQQSQSATEKDRYY